VIPNPDWIRVQQQAGSGYGFSKISGSGLGFSEYGSRTLLLGTGIIPVSDADLDLELFGLVTFGFKLVQEQKN
jgi:hypothetical protein